jgi:hypothetical protein
MRLTLTPSWNGPCLKITVTSDFIPQTVEAQFGVVGCLDPPELLQYAADGIEKEAVAKWWKVVREQVEICRPHVNGKWLEIPPHDGTIR